MPYAGISDVLFSSFFACFGAISVGFFLNNSNGICKAPSLQVKALNNHSITHIMYIEMEMLLVT